MGRVFFISLSLCLSPHLPQVSDSPPPPFSYSRSHTPSPALVPLAPSPPPPRNSTIVSGTNTKGSRDPKKSTDPLAPNDTHGPFPVQQAIFPRERETDRPAQRETSEICVLPASGERERERERDEEAERREFDLPNYVHAFTFTPEGGGWGNRGGGEGGNRPTAAQLNPTL